LTCKTFLFQKIRKKQTLLLEGDICTYNAFIEKGILRSYTTDEKGMNTSYSLLLKVGGSVIYRVLMGKHSTYTIEAIEDSELLLLTASAKELMNALPVFERYQRLLLENAFIALQSRVNSALTATAEKIH
jgi:CRP-like cAMP-binding protein